MLIFFSIKGIFKSFQNISSRLWTTNLWWASSVAHELRFSIESTRIILMGKLISSSITNSTLFYQFAVYLYQWLSNVFNFCLFVLSFFGFFCYCYCSFSFIEHFLVNMSNTVPSPQSVSYFEKITLASLGLFYFDLFLPFISLGRLKHW